MIRNRGVVVIAFFNFFLKKEKNNDCDWYVNILKKIRIYFKVFFSCGAQKEQILFPFSFILDFWILYIHMNINEFILLFFDLFLTVYYFF